MEYSRVLHKIPQNNKKTQALVSLGQESSSDISLGVRVGNDPEFEQKFTGKRYIYH